MDKDWPLSRRRRLKLRLFLAARSIVVPLLRLTIRLRIEGLENVPTQGPALMISNHLHNADPIVLEAAFPRPIFFMAKKEVFRVPVARWVARQTGAFPVDRGKPDRSALRQADRLLSEGMIVGMFPEGTRSVTGGLKEPFPGAALVALRSRVPIVPTTIFGTSSLPFNGKKGRWEKGWPHVTVRIGKPFLLPEQPSGGGRPNLGDLTDLMMVEIGKLLPPKHRGIYTDQVAHAETSAECARTALDPEPASQQR